MAGFRLRIVVCAVAVIAGVVVAGCASMGGLSSDSPPEAKAAVVSERAQARWQALIKGDLDEAYTYLSAASREAYSLKVYRARTKPGMWKAIKIDGVNCEAELCQLTMWLTYDHRMMKGVQTPLTESWIIEKGTAWYVYEPHG